MNENTESYVGKISFISCQGLFYCTLTLSKLRAKSHAAFQCDGLTVHVLEVGGCQLYAHAADLLLRIAVMACRRHLHVCLESFGISLLKAFQLGCPCQRADDVHVDVVTAPLGGCHPGQTTDAFLGCCVSTLSVVDENTEKTYTGYKNIKKTVTDGKVLFVLDDENSKLVVDIYVINTDSKESDVYAYYNGDTKSTAKDETKIGLYINGELTYYVFNKSANNLGLEDEYKQDGMPKAGIYKVELTDTDVTKMVGQKLTNDVNRLKVTATGEDYFQTGTTADKNVLKHFYDEEVKVYDITDDGKEGTVAKNDYVVFINKSGDIDFVTYVYIVSAPDTTTADTDTTVSSNGFTVANKGNSVEITAPANTTVTSYTIEVNKLVDGLNGKQYVPAGKDDHVATDNNCSFRVSETGVYVLKITANVSKTSGEATTTVKVDLGTFGEWYLTANN